MNHKRRIAATLTTLFVLMLMSCTKEETRFATITGQYNGETKGKEIHLCKVEHGAKTKVATTVPEPGGKFAFACPVNKPGLYVINVVWQELQRVDRRDHDLKRFYLENGVEVDIQLSDGSYKLQHTNSDKNTLLSQWNTQIDTAYTYSHGFTYHMSSYTDFFPLLPGYVEQSEAFKKNIHTGDADFDELLRLMVDTDMASSALRMIQTPRSVHPKREDYPDYYDFILTEMAPKSERLLELPNGISYMRSFATYTIMSLPEKPSKEEYHAVSFSTISNDLLKGYFALDNVKYFRTYDDSYLAFRKLANPYLKNDYLKKEFKDFELSIRKFEKGSLAADFSGKDIYGKEHKLSDYKGMPVYVDVWATWCGPCKIQLPKLKELEKKFHNQPVTFLSISVDKPADEEKWKKFVQEENLIGVQIMAENAFDSEFAKVYGINAIPRFMLFDKDGKVVSIDAPRPSEESTEGLIRSLL